MANEHNRGKNIVKIKKMSGAHSRPKSDTFQKTLIKAYKNK